MFTNLNTHSYYSLLSSTLSIDDIINFAIKDNQKVVSLIDINNMYGAMEFYTKAIANNLKPIIGLKTIYKNIELIIVALNYLGYQKLCEICSIINSLNCSNLSIEKFNDSSLAFILKNQKDLNIFDNLPKHYFFINGDSEKVIACNEVYYQHENDHELLSVLLCIKNENLLNKFVLNESYLNKYLISEEIAKKKYSSKALENLSKLIQLVDLNIDFYKENHFVKYDSGKSAKLLLQNLCKEGLRKLFPNNQAPVNYIDRLKYELDVIDKMSFNDYFLVVQDYVNYAKNHDILVGPGRGSVAGSLVAYTLGITQIDPIKNNLIFERFLNPERQTMPDIDIDFMDSRRDEIVQYLFEKYGINKTAHIVTFQRMKAKMVLRDVGRVLNIDLKIINAICKLFLNEYDLDIDLAISQSKQIAEYSQIYSKLFMFSKAFLNFPRQTGLHAAGIVICDKILNSILPTQITDNGTNATQYSMEYLEPLGLIKIDILGIINLTIIQQTIELIKATKSVSIDLSNINLTDPKVFQELSLGRTLGIFQLESAGMTRLITQIKPQTIEDISITSALFRPGPQKQIEIYLKNRAHPSEIKYLNKDFETVLKSTFGIMVYQEQVIEIVRKVANFSLAKADVFRRAISKKNAKQLKSLKDEFIAGGLKNNYNKESLEEIFDYISAFANYGFNHSHSLAYSYISYWMAYLRTYYPIQFFTVLLALNANSIDKVSIYIQELKKYNIKISPPDILESNASFKIKDNKIIFGFDVIKGIGNETITKILKSQKKVTNQDDLYEILSVLAKNGIGIKSIELLIKAGSFDRYLSKNQTRHFLLENLEQLYEVSKSMYVNGQLLVDVNFKDNEPSQEQKDALDNEQFKLIGVNFKMHPLEVFRKSHTKFNEFKKLIDLKNEQLNTYGKALVLIKSHRTHLAKNGKSMAFLRIEDETLICDAVVFSGVYEKIKPILSLSKPLLATLKNDTRSFQLIKLEVIDSGTNNEK